MIVKLFIVVLQQDFSQEETALEIGQASAALTREFSVQGIWNVELHKAFEVGINLSNVKR